MASTAKNLWDWRSDEGRESWSKDGLILAAERVETSAQGRGSTRSSVMVPSCLGVGGAREGTGLPGGVPAHRALLQPGFCPIRPSGVAPGPWQTVDGCSWVRAAGCWSCVRNPELLAQRVWGCAVPQLGVFAEIPLKAERVLGTELVRSKLKSLVCHCPSANMGWG